MKRLRKFNSLPSGDRLLLISTFVWLGLVRLGLWLLPFRTWRRLIASVSRTNHKPQEVGKTDQGKIVWAVNVAVEELTNSYLTYSLNEYKKSKEY